MRSLAVAALAASVAVTGCTTNPYTGDKQASKAAWGAAIGALSVAAVGAATGDNKKDRRERALKGAAIGGVPFTRCTLTSAHVRRLRNGHRAPTRPIEPLPGCVADRWRR